MWLIKFMSLIFPEGGRKKSGLLTARVMNDLLHFFLNILVIFWGHRPWSSINKEHTSLFDRYGVDIYFAGHVHAYGRSHPYKQVRHLFTRNYVDSNQKCTRWKIFRTDNFNSQSAEDWENEGAGWNDSQIF